MRWEVIGNILTLAAVSFIDIPNSSRLLSDRDHDQSRTSLLGEILSAADCCQKFCNQIDENELVVSFHYNYSMLATFRHGYSARALWGNVSSLAAAIYASGVHLDAVSDDHPLFLRQWRRRCFAAAFVVDKSLATYLRRPPLLQSRYCVLTPPLDIDDEEDTVQSNVSVDETAEYLNEYGWNVGGVPRPITFIRLRFLNLLRRAEATWNACPVSMRYTPSLWNQDRDIEEIWFLMLTYLDYLYSLFLIHMTVAQHTATKSAALYSTARELLQRNRVSGVKSDLTWVFLLYGLSSAELPSHELLLQSQSQHPSSPETTHLPRSELIQNLSVFISYLDWVAMPGHRNHDPCKEGVKKLKGILDQILDPRSQERQELPEPMMMTAGGDYYYFARDGVGDVEFPFDWYNLGSSNRGWGRIV
ncbi:hypothetical protein M432DRAFT_592153 [Thermoascus aurantiacus ATCC 26904]